MKTFQLFLVTILLALAASKPNHEHKEKFKKHMQCVKQTMDLKDCCELPEPKKDEESECKSELEGIEEKEGKEKGKAWNCFLECEFKSKGFLEEKEIKWDKLREYSKEHAGDAPGFEEVGEKSMDFCEEKIKAKIEEFKANKPKHDKPKGEEGKKHCCMMPSMVTGCLVGYVVRDCPADKWKNTDECNAIKANATSIEECMS